MLSTCCLLFLHSAVHLVSKGLSCRDSFAHSWHSLNQLHLESFFNSLEGVPTYAEHLLAAFPSLCSPTHLNLVEVWGLWRPGHLMQHSITLILGQISLTQPGGVLGHCPVEKQMIVPRSPNQMGLRITAKCCGTPSHLLCV